MPNLKKKNPKIKENKKIKNNSNLENSLSQDEEYWESTIFFFKILPIFGIILFILLIMLCNK